MRTRVRSPRLPLVEVITVFWLNVWFIAGQPTRGSVSRSSIQNESPVSSKSCIESPDDVQGSFDLDSPQLWSKAICTRMIPRAEFKWKRLRLEAFNPPRKFSWDQVSISVETISSEPHLILIKEGSKPAVNDYEHSNFCQWISDESHSTVFFSYNENSRRLASTDLVSGKVDPSRGDTSSNVVFFAEEEVSDCPIDKCKELPEVKQVANECKAKYNDIEDGTDWEIIKDMREVELVIKCLEKGVKLCDKWLKDQGYTDEQLRQQCDDDRNKRFEAHRQGNGRHHRTDIDEAKSVKQEIEMETMLFHQMGLGMGAGKEAQLQMKNPLSDSESSCDVSDFTSCIISKQAHWSACASRMGNKAIMGATSEVDDSHLVGFTHDCIRSQIIRCKSHLDSSIGGRLTLMADVATDSRLAQHHSPQSHISHPRRPYPPDPSLELGLAYSSPQHSRATRRCLAMASIPLFTSLNSMSETPHFHHSLSHDVSMARLSVSKAPVVWMGFRSASGSQTVPGPAPVVKINLSADVGLHPTGRRLTTLIPSDSSCHAFEHPLAHHMDKLSFEWLSVSSPAAKTAVVPLSVSPGVDWTSGSATVKDVKSSDLITLKVVVHHMDDTRRLSGLESGEILDNTATPFLTFRPSNHSDESPPSRILATEGYFILDLQIDATSSAGPDVVMVANSDESKNPPKSLISMRRITTEGSDKKKTSTVYTGKYGREGTTTTIWVAAFYTGRVQTDWLMKVIERESPGPSGGHNVFGSQPTLGSWFSTVMRFVGVIAAVVIAFLVVTLLSLIGVIAYLKLHEPDTYRRYSERYRFPVYTIGHLLDRVKFRSPKSIGPSEDDTSLIPALNIHSPPSEEMSLTNPTKATTPSPFSNFSGPGAQPVPGGPSPVQLELQKQSIAGTLPPMYSDWRSDGGSDRQSNPAYPTDPSPYDDVEGQTLESHHLGMVRVHSQLRQTTCDSDVGVNVTSNGVITYPPAPSPDHQISFSEPINAGLTAVPEPLQHPLPEARGTPHFPPSMGYSTSPPLLAPYRSDEDALSCMSSNLGPSASVVFSQINNDLRQDSRPPTDLLTPQDTSNHTGDQAYLPAPTSVTSPPPSTMRAQPPTLGGAPHALGSQVTSSQLYSQEADRLSNANRAPRLTVSEAFKSHSQAHAPVASREQTGDQRAPHQAQQTGGSCQRQAPPPQPSTPPPQPSTTPQSSPLPQSSPSPQTQSPYIAQYESPLLSKQLYAASTQSAKLPPVRHDTGSTQSPQSHDRYRHPSSHGVMSGHLSQQHSSSSTFSPHSPYFGREESGSTVLGYERVQAQPTKPQQADDQANQQSDQGRQHLAPFQSLLDTNP
eukprot:GHVN01034215.1.p2 GENE.GHVN01034215.1~~GHVN01034215.1.p2  ORF type:complete len:1334 (+),score=278.56 GHVN01034215.1:50-4051(+)